MCNKVHRVLIYPPVCLPPCLQKVGFVSRDLILFFSSQGWGSRPTFNKQISLTTSAVNNNKTEASYIFTILKKAFVGKPVCYKKKSLSIHISKLILRLPTLGLHSLTPTYPSTMMLHPTQLCQQGETCLSWLPDIAGVLVGDKNLNF